MSLLYRTVWKDTTEPDRHAVIDLALEYFSRWALDNPEATALCEGETIADGKVVTVRLLDNDSGYGVEACSRDERLSAVWSVTMRALATDTAVHVWIDVDMETDDPTQRVVVGGPRLVNDLLALPGRPALGVNNIVADVVGITATEIALLVDLLRSADRTLPFIVVSAPASGTDPLWQERARRIAQRTRGIATVIVLDETATASFKAKLGPLAVWNGAVRTYVPAPLETEADGWRHRYVPSSALAGASGAAAADRIVYAVAQLSTRRRVPAELRVFTGNDRNSVDQTLVEQVREELQFEVDLAHDELADVQRELARANGHLERLRRALEAQGLVDLYWGTSQAQEDVGDASRPETVQDVSEAVAAARTYLSAWLTIAPSAARELQGIDTSPNAFALGNSAWRGLQALAAYAQAKQAGAGGNFWSWCERGEAFSWPASSKRLAMRESETLRNGRHAESRIFEVDPQVGLGPRVFMEAHLKVSEGGGALAPRIYFYDDTDGATGRIHVGFVGPHFLVPNSKA
ncbi:MULTISPECIES: hypothetical protein [Micromonospora]|nr:MULTISPECIES: hypothetical protein [Micromonospora]